ncbi:ABC transporter ATP-binding protein [bacterium]|nr:ABC transporter ATP-binding protein [bacterium]
MPILEVKNLSKKFKLYHQKTQSAVEQFLMLKKSSFEILWALEDVSFTADAGRILGLIGRNGSGKSTLLKVLSRIYKPNSGTFKCNGRLASLLELGAGFHPELTGRENIYLNGSILGIPKSTITDRFDDIVAFSGLEKFLETPIKTYSSGMVIRLGFSVAIVSEPDVLLVDEVLGVGDVAFARRSIEKINELKAKGVAIIFVSHDMPLVASISDETLWLDNGKVEKIGESREIIREYLARLRTISTRDSYHSLGAAPVPDTVDGPVIIEDIRIYDSSDSEAYLFKTNDTMTIAVQLKRREKIGTTHLRIAIQTASGEECLGPVLKTIENPPETMKLKYRMNSLPLNKGEYQLNVAVMDSEMVSALDVRLGGLGFTIGGDASDTSGGLWHIDGEWV